MKLRARYNCVGGHIIGPIYAHSMMTFEGRLFWSMLYYTNVTSEETAMDHMRLIKETLDMAVAE